ncbi:DUF4097 family beta strand repeat-containing protein [Streptococcus sp. NLN64]|uniref:DUF4097 family beta strand repeat-containing protein n=1 Tax=Streptococcus sp. NLN64 TaxID=2822799 RepID=UPI0018C93894|nr:DUF4097 family beta strand repeat-containing protein [Streptococcus sp. NLN64]MBG9368016.1 DUF4097 family beta strand repeat protein [Streptococcus sp. NLN64]
MKFKKIWFLSLFLILIGACVSVLAISNGAIKELDKIYATTPTEEWHFQTKKQIQIDLTRYDLTILPSKDNQIHLQYAPLTESDQQNFQIKEEKDSFILTDNIEQKSPTVTIKGFKALYHILQHPKQKQPGTVHLFLPTEGSVQSLTIQSEDGSVEINKLQFSDLQIHSENGDINLIQTRSEKATIQTEMGEITLDRSQLKNSLMMSELSPITLLEGLYNSVQLQAQEDSIWVDHSIFKGKNTLISENGDIEILLSKDQEATTLLTGQSSFNDDIDLPTRYRNISNPSVEILVETDSGSISVLE